MYNLEQYIFDHFKNKLINSKDILNILILLINNYSLENYISKIILSSNPYILARYYSSKKIIIINYDKLLENTINYLKEQGHNDILLINLYIIKILWHEIIHALQKQIIENNTNEISKIFTLSENLENSLKQQDINFYLNHKYFYNPLERQANINSVKNILNLTILSKENLNYFTLEYLFYCLNGYDFGYPILKFFNNTVYDKKIKSLIQKSFNYDLQIELGLKLEYEEYNELELQKIKLLRSYNDRRN